MVKKTSFPCPNCGKPVEVVAADLRRMNQPISCPSCRYDIYLQESKALEKMKEQLE